MAGSVLVAAIPSTALTEAHGRPLRHAASSEGRRSPQRKLPQVRQGNGYSGLGSVQLAVLSQLHG